MRSTLAFAALALASCAPSGTELVVEAIGEPGAVVSYGDQSVTLDAQGRGSLWVPALHIESFGSSNIQLIDPDGREVLLHIEHEGHALDLPPVCLPPLAIDGGPIQRANLLVRRLLTNHSCRLVNPSVVQNGATLTGEYTAGQFDDYPCGPF